MVTGAEAGTWRKALAEDDWSRHLTNLDGWRKFTTAGARPPGLPDGPQWEAMAEADRDLYDEYRLDTTPGWRRRPPRPCGRSLSRDGGWPC